MHSFDSLARSMATAPRRQRRARPHGPTLIASIIALSCAAVPLATMVQVYISTI